MKRIHLFEFEDQKWFPSFLRNYATDFLQFLANKTNMYKAIVPLLSESIDKTNATKIIDLCSGGGGGLLTIHKALKDTNNNIKCIFSDYYPNIPAFKKLSDENEDFDFIPIPVDARDVPKKLTGFRTLFLSFHHFTPDDAKSILQNAIDTNNSIAIFEAQERSLPSILAMLFSPITLLITTPFIKPFRFKRLLFTYLIPILPIVVLWDGITSSFRTYSVKEMNDLVKSLLNKDNFDWKIGKQKSGPATILYLIGTKK